MITGLLGLTGTGKSTVAAAIAQKRPDLILFDMDIEVPQEFRERNKAGEVVPVAEVKEYQRPLIDRLLVMGESTHVLMAGFFLDNEFPLRLENHLETIWINLLTNNYNELERRVLSRKHFASVPSLQANWQFRKEQIIGDIVVECDRPLEVVVKDCLRYVRGREKEIDSIPIL